MESKIIKFVSLIAMLVILVPCLVLGQERSFIADTEKFGVRLFLVPNADAFVDMWSKPETPKLKIFKQTPINSSFSGIILYWGGGQNANGECNIQLQTSVLKGDLVLAKTPEMSVCSKHPPPKPGVLALSDTIVDLVASGEPAHLEVKVSIIDKVNNENLLVSAPIEVTAKGFMLFPFDSALTNFIQNYHFLPSPNVAIDKFFELDIDKFEKIAEEQNQPHSRALLLAFYANILNENNKLAIPFATRLTKESKGAKASLGTEILTTSMVEEREEAIKIIIDGFNLNSEVSAQIKSGSSFPYLDLKGENWQALDVIWACS